ncbi:MAG TPA: glycogen debranching protein GlgX [Steroidobacteraceae bacterium]|nr:glycogen debranching protein GlgX [Steroidobacteraceae bacterium]
MSVLECSGVKPGAEIPAQAAGEHGLSRSFGEYSAEVCEDANLRRGVPLPLGTHEFGGGVNFALFSHDATRVRLELFGAAADSIPQRVIELDPVRNRTGDVWHVWVQGLKPGQLYAYRVDGPYDPRQGQRFNFKKLLLDPCATAITQPPAWDPAAARGDDPAASHGNTRPSDIDDAAVMPKCVFTREQFDWGDDAALRYPWSKTVIYETHVRGFTIDPSSGAHFPGTYRGLTEKIPYLKELGVTAIELLPVQEFNSSTSRARDPRTGAMLGNYWGYDPMAFLAPHGGYSSAGCCGQQTLEFKQMVRELHEAGIEVIIDIVLNHTAEGDERGPTLSWRGIDNPIFYTLGPDKRHYLNMTGAGNTINANHPVVRGLILSALRYWVLEMHVDGFRFDLAALLGRDGNGNLLANPPLLEQIAEDPILRDTKLIADAWDAAGARHVGRSPQRRWAQWNSRYRDDVRRFWRGDAGMLGAFASRLCGSQDLFAGLSRGPEYGINFITCHDGFTLNDLVTFSTKHNAANGESNRDGVEENYSSNYGVEGPTDDAQIERTRNRQVKNLLFTLFVSRGVPMLLGGDEFRRTQGGNNNAYCQDNPTSWYDWKQLHAHADVVEFVKRMIALRGAYPVLSRERFYSSADVSWFTPALTAPDWSDPRAKALGWLIRDGSAPLYVLFNAAAEPARFVMPPAPQGCGWRMIVNTADDFQESRAAIIEAGSTCTLAARSSALLITSAVTAANTGDQKPIFRTVPCDPAVEACAKAMGGTDPDSAYAAAMLWSQGYPEGSTGGKA